ncbi:spore coat protein CotJB [Aneurinibacillus terranovensis]|uniref:spore coat protein CotJB n=1 Tax=Aneurinibacillus terranovensis TaxID=278991 RepID=UPI00040D3A9A|nr:spore coat protein CotJB [Aneurinibacillus terranovensis]
MNPDENYYNLLLEIQQNDFVLYELNLYLNTHPLDQDAITQYNEFSQRNKMLRQHFESMYGPLMHAGQSFSTAPWSWSNSPWPWQV